MASQVGAVLREARNRRKIDLSEVEATTRIRVRYLRAIENEEWDVLPGEVYTRGFIRTYASYLGLDGERLAEDYRRSVEGARNPGPDQAPIAVSAGPLGPRWRLPGAGWLAAAGVVLLAVVALVAIPESGGGGDPTVLQQPSAEDRTEGEQQARPTKQASSVGVSVRLAASAEVWVCVLDAKGQQLIDGQILEAGAEEGPFRSGSFTVSLGNGEVSMLIDGREAEIPVTSSPLGYSIDASGGLTQLDEAERPTCT